MEIQWVMLAKEIKTNPDTTMCIDGIFHYLTRVLPEIIVPMLLITKVKLSITEADDAKEVAIAIEHIQRGVVWINKFPYKVHDIGSILNEQPYMVVRLLDVKFPYSGEYTFKVFVDKEYKNEESITVAIDRNRAR